MPAFSPCGAIVDYLRSCYSAPCRWYPDGPVGEIVYYFVPETNGRFLGPNIFIPASQELQHVNNGVGELAGPGIKRKYRKGLPPVPLQDGRHPCGSEDDFRGRGQATLPGGYIRPEDLCECDFGPFAWPIAGSLTAQDASRITFGAPVGFPFYWSGEGALTADGVAPALDAPGVGDLTLNGVGAIEDVWSDTGLILEGVAPTSLGGEVILDGADAGSFGGEVILDGVVSTASMEGDLTIDDATEIT